MKDEPETRTVKIDFPVSYNTDIMIVLTGPAPNHDGFLRIHKMLDLLESSLNQVIIKAEEEPAPPRKPRSDCGLPKGEWLKASQERKEIVLREFMTNLRGRTVYLLAKDLSIPYSTVQNILRRNKLIP